jgi:hypothetical protein
VGLGVIGLVLITLLVGDGPGMGLEERFGLRLRGVMGPNSKDPIDDEKLEMEAEMKMGAEPTSAGLVGAEVRGP